ncbi:uncharacterized protein LOC126202926 isoform X3 [Schistocerca nitens]|uniref:uncharacterized protein LOC126202926 isoform X3 n=1 Tax=Schistocerca nitens TaxID=7011 RepID=UPI00211893A1|nr:uncharacterized protein LOC126202926 isoform X3 [Schistocerca nitens]
MGNHHSHDVLLQNSLPRNNSGSDLHDKTPTQLVPIDKLAKILAQKSLEEDSVQGITSRIFTKYVFPRYPDLSQRLFLFFHSSAGPQKHEWLSQTTFKQQAERFLGVLADERQIEIYVKMYSSDDSEVTQENFRDLLMAAYRLAMDHYPEGSVTCKRLYHTLQAVIDSAFHRKKTLSVTYLTHWIQQHCPRLTVGLFRFVVHVLSTAYRSLGQDNNGPAELDLSTPVLEREISFAPKDDEEEMLPVSEVWLLSLTLPAVFTRPSPHHSPASSANGLSSQQFIAKMLGCICPSHWVLLYNSSQHGLGANRFMHHVLGYKGPTLIFVRGEQDTQFCLSASSEWRESHQYWGDEDCVLLQMLPRYHVVEKGPKLLYLNTSIRGYPVALRAGQDPRKPSLEVDIDFSVVKFCDIPYSLLDVEVWGCGPQQSRESQLEIKKWQVKQAEKQRVVKLSAAEWVDHPDRYLLELAGHDETWVHHSELETKKQSPEKKKFEAAHDDSFLG